MFSFAKTLIVEDLLKAIHDQNPKAPHIDFLPGQAALTAIGFLLSLTRFRFAHCPLLFLLYPSASSIHLLRRCDLK